MFTPQSTAQAPATIICLRKKKIRLSANKHFTTLLDLTGHPKTMCSLKGISFNYGAKLRNNLLNPLYVVVPSEIL